MRRLAAVAAAVAVGAGFLAASAAPAAAQDSPSTLAQPRPSWFTKDLEARVAAAGRKGVEVPLSKRQQAELNCLGTSPPYAGTDGVSLTAVSAGGCMVSPAGCTMNFVFTDGSSRYIGTAGHCLTGGSKVVMQVATRVDPTDTVFVTLAQVGTVARKWDQGIGRDFGLVKLAAGWKVVPAVAGALGPIGVFCGDPLGQPVMHYGHGYAFFVEQGHPKFGEVIPDLSLLLRGDWANGFNWVGYGLPGDSGSGVMNAAGLAVGDLTHGIGVAGVPVPGLNFGTTMGGIFKLIGSSYKLVTATNRAVNCANPLGV